MKKNTWAIRDIEHAKTFHFTSFEHMHEWINNLKICDTGKDVMEKNDVENLKKVEKINHTLSGEEVYDCKCKLKPFKPLKSVQPC